MSPWWEVTGTDVLAVTPVVFLLLCCCFPALCSSVLSIQPPACLCRCSYTIPAEMCSLCKGFTSDSGVLTDFGVPVPQRTSSLCTGMLLQRLIAPKSPPSAPVLRICSSLLADPGNTPQNTPGQHDQAALAPVHGCAGTSNIPSLEFQPICTNRSIY